MILYYPTKFHSIIFNSFKVMGRGHFPPHTPPPPTPQATLIKPRRNRVKKNKENGASARMEIVFRISSLIQVTSCYGNVRQVMKFYQSIKRCALSLYRKHHRSRKINEKLHEYFMKVIVIPRVLSTSVIFHFHKIRLQFFINSSRTKVVFPFNSIPTKNTILTFLWKKEKVAARTDMF